MNLHIAIVEDDEENVSILKSYISRYIHTEMQAGGSHADDSLEVSVFSDGDEIAYKYVPRYHIIFMDIRMKRMDGMTAAQEIRKLDKDVIIIFITNMAQYAVKGYSVAALDFLLKPVSYFVFAQQLKRSIDKIKHNQTSYIVLPSEDGLVKQDISEIVLIESSKHKITVCTKSSCYRLVSTCTMKNLEEKVAGKNFFRCNNCYLVNLSCVKAIRGNSVLIQNRDLLISRPRKKAFMQALSDYMSGM